MEKFPLKVLRAMADMTQKQVADAVGIKRETYGKWERYETYPDAMQLIKLSEIFKCSLDAFYFPTSTNLKLTMNKDIRKIS